jgi:hypothetical protein
VLAPLVMIWRSLASVPRSWIISALERTPSLFASSSFWKCVPALRATRVVAPGMRFAVSPCSTCQPSATASELAVAIAWLSYWPATAAGGAFAASSNSAIVWSKSLSPASINTVRGALSVNVNQAS